VAVQPIRGVHKVVMGTIGVEIFHLVLFQGCSFYGIGRAKAVFKRRAGANVSQFGLYHCSQIARGVVSEFNNFAGLTFKNDYHTATDLGCRNCHKLISNSIYYC
jgi:hypothetical protein